MLAVEQRQLDILHRGGAREQIEALENETDLAVADVGQLVAIESGDVGAVEQVTAARRAVEAAEHVHQGRFARAARAHDGDELAALDLQRNAAHRMHIHLAGAVGLVDVLQLDDSGVLGHSIRLEPALSAGQRIGRCVAPRTAPRCRSWR